MENIAVVFGGESVERDISIITAMQTLQNIDRRKYNPLPIYLDGGKEYLVDSNKCEELPIYASGKHKYMKECKLYNGGLYLFNRGKLKKGVSIDCVLLCTHGGSGENGELQGFLEFNNFAYTSTDVRASAICMDKGLTHKLASKLGAKSVKNITIDSRGEVDYQGIIEKLGNKLIIKPNSLGSSIGIGVAKDMDSLKECIITASLYDNKLVIEQMVENMLEFNCAAVMTAKGLVVSGVDSPYTQNDILNFNDKYIDGIKYINWSKSGEIIPENIVRNVQNTTVKMYRELISLI